MDFDNQIKSSYLLEFRNFDCVGITKVSIEDSELKVDTIKKDMIFNLSKFDEDLKLDAIEDFTFPPKLNLKCSKLGDSKLEQQFEVIGSKNQGKVLKSSDFLLNKPK